MERRNISVPKTHSGEAVARIVHDGLNVPHSTAKGLIDAGCVTINGRPARSHGQRCEGGDVVEVRFDPERRYLPHPQPRHGPGFRVVHEDAEIVVVDKTPGLLSSPAPGRRDESLAELIAESLRSRGIKKPQLFVVHRLDQHTSGLLVFARTTRAMEGMATQFESREAGKTYVAVVHGRVARERGTIQSWLVEDPKSFSVRTTPTRGAGKRALTHFAVVERFEDTTLVRVVLETGRKHQIRVHFAEIGHPILGDRRYGEASPLLARVALHAERLSFRHPRTIENLTFEAPWPDDFAKLVLRLRRGADRSAGEDDRDDAGSDASDANGRDHDEAPPREETPFARGRMATATPRADAQRAAPRGTDRSGAPVEVFPRGLTLTDPLGSASAWLEGKGSAEPPRAHAVARAPVPAAPRAAGDEREGFTRDRRDRLLRQRSVGQRPGVRRTPEGQSAPPHSSSYRHKGAPDARHVGAKPWARKPGADRQAGEKPPADSRRAQGDRSPGGKPWTTGPQGGSSRPQAREGGAPREGKPWRDKSREGGAARAERPWRDKPREGDRGAARVEKPWRDKPHEGGAVRAERPWRDKPREGDRGGARGAARGEKPWRDRPREGGGAARAEKPWQNKPRDGQAARAEKPWRDKPREGQAARAGKPWRDRPEGRPGPPRKGPGDAPRSGQPWKARPRSQEPGRARGDETSSGGKPWMNRTQGRSSPLRSREGEAARGERPWQDRSREREAPRGEKPWRAKAPAGEPRERKWVDRGPRDGKPRDVKSWTGGTSHGARARTAGPSRDARAKTGGPPRDAKAKTGGPPRDARPWKDRPPRDDRARSKDRARGTVAAQDAGAAGGGPPASKKPWEFKEKGSTLRWEQRRKAAASRSKGQGKGKKR